MREITDSDQLYNGLEPGETPVLMTLDEARLIARAFIVVNQKYANEVDRILASEESEYLKQAAMKQYQTDTEAYTKLHVKMAEVFPELTQR